jgi:DNA-binding response OmpR family regulator
MMTARSSDLDYATGLDLGCDDYITKPFKIADLVERVDKVFERVESQMEGYNDTSVHR